MILSGEPHLYTALLVDLPLSEWNTWLLLLFTSYTSAQYKLRRHCGKRCDNAWITLLFPWNMNWRAKTSVLCSSGSTVTGDPPACSGRSGQNMWGCWAKNTPSKVGEKQQKNMATLPPVRYRPQPLHRAVPTFTILGGQRSDAGGSLDDGCQILLVC